VSAVALVIHQFTYERKVFWRSPPAVFFTVMFPVIFLLLFGSLFGGGEIDELGINVITYYVPGLITLAIVSSTLVSVAMRIVEMRESGRLKRLHGTPLPTWAFIGGRIANSFAIGVLMVVVVSVIARVLYDVPLPTGSILAVLLTLLVGTFAFCALGLALSTVIPTEDAAPPITNAVVFPLYFLSGVFVPQTEIPTGVLHVAAVFPVRHLFQAFLEAYDPNTVGVGIAWGHLAIVALWGLVGVALTLRFFRWSPRAG